MNRRINAEHYKEEMRKVIVSYGLSPDNIYFVDVLPYKCSPFAPAQAHRIEKKIYFKCTLDHYEIGASFHNMSASGIPENKIIKLRRDDWLFSNIRFCMKYVKYLILHGQILSGINGLLMRWAFKRVV